MTHHSRRSAPSSQAAKRRGQALLLAVLLMVFVALLGATFVSVVALNLNRTARQEDQIAARQAVQAGIGFVNAQLVNSAQGDKWRPEMFNAPPAPGDADYNLYYTPLQRAQGWARTTPHPDTDLDGDGQIWSADAPDPQDDWLALQADRRNGARVYVRFPDPRGPNPDDGPAFLAEVREESGAQRGMLQISVIGLTAHNPLVFERSSAWRGGPAQSPLTAAARSVTNWDFVQRTVPVAQAAAGLAAPAVSLPVKNVRGAFPPGGFYIVIGDPSSGKVQSAVVVSYAPGSDASGTFTLATPVTAMLDERVEMAAGLGAPAQLDFNMDGVRAPGSEDVSFKTSASGAPGGVWVNGGLVWFGSVVADNLRAPQLGGAAGAVRASGLMCYNSAPTNPGDPTVQIAGATYDSPSGAAALSRATLSTDSAAPDFPGAWADAEGQALTVSEKAQLVDDGWNRLAGAASGERQVQPFTPPDVSGGGNGAGRYRQLSKFSAPANPGDPPQAAHFGYGEGIYINNVRDVERLYDATAGKLRPMTQAELLELWLGSATARSEARLGTPANPAALNASLEQQHLRGWIGPDEFRARGAEVELDPANRQVIITRDARADNVPGAAANSRGPVASQTWADAGGAPRIGLYRQRFAWPKNGVIFAEGNLRVKGGAPDAAAPGAPDPGNSLTLVSMNNIYIEGSLNAGKRKILLLARKNVILNPTGVVARVDAQTRVRDASDPNLTRVYDATSFRPGERVTVEDGATVTQHTIVSISNAPDDPALQLSPPLNAAPDAALRSQSDPLESGLPPSNFSRLNAFDDAIQRRFSVPLPPGGGASEARLAFRHSANRVTAFTLRARESAPAPSRPDPMLGVKVAPDGSGSVPPAGKTVEVLYNAGGTPAKDSYPLPPPASQGEATAYSITTLRQNLLDALNGHPPPSGPPPYPWYYEASPVAAGYENLPFFYLAQVGNRCDGYDGVAPNGQPPAMLRPNLLAADYALPLATSVTLSADGAVAPLRSDVWDAARGSFEKAHQFGFNSRHGAQSSGGASADDSLLTEDVATGDQSFYSADANRFSLDSRVLEGVGSGLHSLVLSFTSGSGLDGDAAVASYFGGAAPPAYRVSRLKLENADQLNAQNQFEKLAPGCTLDVRAFVYAQEGSWIVIPGAPFDARLRAMPGVEGSYLETNEPPNGPGPGEYLDADNSGTFTDGDYADLDHDGAISRAEKVAVYRYGRYNYKINFSGSIMENQTALVRDPDGNGPLLGAVEAWMDKWSTVNIGADNWGGPAQDDDLTKLPDAAQNSFGNISYAFDDAPARGFFDLNGNGQADPGEDVSDDAGFRAPAMPGLLYQN